MKSDRHNKILELIQQYPIDRQEDLMQYLNEAGFRVTQATVSRDIRELNLLKVATGGGKYRYASAVTAGNTSVHSQGRFETIFRESVLKADYAGHTVLIKCFSGMANAACELFDSMQWEHEIVGTLAGDDTFLILMRAESDAKDLCQTLSKYIVKK